MKNKLKTITVPARERTHPTLIEAGKLMKAYASSTGTHATVCDHNCMSIPEFFNENTSGKNICLFCMKHRNKMQVSTNEDFAQNPCRSMHLNAIREVHRFGGTYTYMCDLGFLFWTSPIYADERFIGALMGSGYLGVDKEEACAKMELLCDGAESKAELMKKIETFPRGDPQKVKALAELLLICAESLSTGSNGCHASMRRRAEQQASLSAKIEELKNNYPADGKQPEYPLDKEQKLLEALRRGDAQEGREILNEILAILLFSNPDQFKFIQYRAMELAVLLSRTDIGPGFSSEVILETNNRYFNSIQEAHNIEELSDALHKIVDDMAGLIFAFQGIRHASALKKAEYYILENFTRKISLKEIARISGFSAPYFSTIFKEEMGENLSGYLNRLRVERAGYLLVNTNLSLSKITRACGFEDQSWFSKIFKAYTGVSPGKYRSQGGKPGAKILGTGLSDNYHGEDTND
jgi:AraC-like DNA-binding protein/ligand-binding sensor protein